MNYICLETEKARMTILITGVAGLIGSRLANYLLNKYPECKIIGIDNLSGGYAENINPKVVFYKLELSKDDISKVFEKHNIEYVFHFAAYAAEGLSPFMRSFNYDNNLISTTRLVNNCIKFEIKRLVFTSSLAVYGHQSGKIFDEDYVPNPIDPYGVAKYACEMDIKIAGDQHGLDWCIIRPHNVYGINQNIWDRYRNVIGIWMYQKLNNLDLTIFGDGSQTRAFSYIDDTLESLWNSAILDNASKQIINLGGTKSISILEACKITSSVVRGSNISFKEHRHEVKHSIPTWKKSVELLGFEHKTDLEVGIKKMWEWAKKQPMRERFVWKEYELNKGIYSFWKS